MICPLLLFFTIIAIAHVTAMNMVEEWEKFLVRYKKPYLPNSREYLTRRAFFLKNLNDIRIHNEQYNEQQKYKTQKITYKLRVNEFTDLSYDEFLEKYSFRKLRYKHCPVNKTSRFRKIVHKPLSKSRRIPNSVDWTRKTVIIEDQGDCHCSWAYATVAAIETALDIHFVHIKELSAHQLRDCITFNAARECVSMMHEKALEYAEKRGIALESYYHRTETKSQCIEENIRMRFKVTEYHRLMQPDEEELQRIIAFIGPAIATVAVPKTFKQYGGEYVYNDPSCTDEHKDQNVAIVGYGVDGTGGPYWLIRNSWGRSWGNNGLMKLARNQSNICGIASEIMYPVVKSIH